MRGLFIGLILCYSGSASSADPCTDPAKRWDCWGSIEMGSSAGRARMSRDEQDRLLAEIEEPGQPLKRMLQLNDGLPERFTGISPPELKPSKSPFRFLDMAFSLPAMALHQAFPEGPASVPIGHLVKTVRVAKLDLELITMRDGNALMIRYELHIQGKPPLSGLWDGARHGPLNDLAAKGDWQEAEALAPKPQ